MQSMTALLEKNSMQPGANIGLSDSGFTPSYESPITVGGSVHRFENGWCRMYPRNLAMEERIAVFKDPESNKKVVQFAVGRLDNPNHKIVVRYEGGTNGQLINPQLSIISDESGFEWDSEKLVREMKGRDYYQLRREVLLAHDGISQEQQFAIVNMIIPKSMSEEDLTDYTEGHSDTEQGTLKYQCTIELSTRNRNQINYI